MQWSTTSQSLSRAGAPGWQAVSCRRRRVHLTGAPCLQVTQKAAAAQKGPRNSPGQRLMHAARSEVDSLTLAELNVLLHLMWERKQTLEQQEAEGNLELLLRFLQHSRYIVNSRDPASSPTTAL